MKNIPALLTDRQIDLRGCEYRESPHLTHIDGLLVYYHQHGQLVLSARLTDSEKLHGVQRLLSKLEPASSEQPQIVFWTKGEAHDAHSPGQRRIGPASQPATPPELPVITGAGANFFAPMSATVKRANRISLLQVPRDFLPRAIHAITDQRPTRGAVPEEGHTFVEEETTTGHLVSLDLRMPSGSRWSIVAQITPPLQGQLHLSLGRSSFQSLLSDDGTGILSEIEPDLLLNANGPDLELWLELERDVDAEQA
jgi:hypothetical protein